MRVYANVYILKYVVCMRSVVSDSLQPHRLESSRLLCPLNFPGENTGGGCHSLLQGIFVTQESNPGLLHCRQILYRLSHQVSQAGLKPTYSALEGGLLTTGPLGKSPEFSLEREGIVSMQDPQLQSYIMLALTCLCGHL